MFFEDAITGKMMVDQFMLTGPENMLTDFMAPPRNRFAFKSETLLRPSDTEAVKPITDAILTGSYLSVKKMCEAAMLGGQTTPAELVNLVNGQLSDASSNYSLKDLGDDKLAINGWKMSELELSEAELPF